MAERRVDRIERRLRALGGRARLQQILEDLRAEEDRSDILYQWLYIAIQQENERLAELGERTRFITSRDGESRGWVRLREASEFRQGTVAAELETKIQRQNERVGEEIRAWLQAMDWRTFESTFLTRVLEALGFQDVEITQATRDGGADARVGYRRGIVEARAIISAKRWTSRTVPVDEVRMLRGIKGEEDTAIIVTTGRFSPDAEAEAKPGQNQRVVYLIDGDKLIDICRRNQIGVKKVTLPEVLILDEEVAGKTASVDGGIGDSEETGTNSRKSRVRHLDDAMLGDRKLGLSAEEVSELSGYALSTVRVYLTNKRREALGNAIRSNDDAHTRALSIISSRRA